MNVFVISLKNSTRRKHVSAILSDIGIRFSFFDAINGNEDHNFQSKHSYLARSYLTSNPLLPGEIGCYASHYSMWKKCVDINEPIVVLEDDIDLTEHTLTVFNELKSLHEKYDYIRLEYARKGHIDIAEQNNIKVVRWLNGRVGTRGYSINPTAAFKLLEGSHSWMVPVDNYIGQSFRHGVISYGVQPYMIHHSERFESSIQNRPKKKVPLVFKPLLKPVHELVRVYYRLRMLYWNHLSKYKIPS